MGAYPFIPVVIGDDDVPAHLVLGNELSLPSVLLIPTLRELRIRNTHLGDSKWATVTPRCHLDTLEIGSCCHESPAFNRTCAERLIDAAGQSVQELSLSAALSSDAGAKTTLKRLSKLRVTSLLPVENLAETLAALSTSPIETLCLQCHEDDVEDECLELADFLDDCDGNQKQPIFSRLRRVSLESVADVLDPSPVKSTIFDCHIEDASRDATSVVHLLREYLEGFQCSDVCTDVVPSELRAFASPLSSICRPVQPIKEQMMWPNIMEAW